VTLRNCDDNATFGIANQVIDGCIYTGDVLVTAANVTIQRSRIYGHVWTNGRGSYTLTDSEVGPTSGCNGDNALGFGNYTARRVYIHNFGDGVRDSGSNITIEDSFLLMCSNAGDHADGVQGYQGGTNIRINHNTIDMRRARDVNAAVFFADNSKAGTVTNNLLAGGGYTLRIHDDATPDIGPWVVTGNRIVAGSWNFGPVNNTNTTCSGSGARMTWSDNSLVTIDADYKVLTIGAAVGCQ
jgi:hypothetical protein